MFFSRFSELFIKKVVFILVCLLIFNVNQLKGQERNCGTMIYFEEQKINNPTLLKNTQDNELKLQNWIKNNTNKNLVNIITIPVVVHVVYNNNNENISDQQIQSQIDILNADFRRQNADAVNTPSAFLSVAADTEIEFCLATEDPNGNITTGITRTSTSQSSFSTNNGVKYTSSGGVDAWNPLEYLNIWVCDLSGGLLGYAQFPGGTVSSDGVVCDYAYFGNMGTATAPYDLGRTATHEVGHWLNLRHIWGDSNCGNDFCNDTPEHSGSNYGCPSYPSTSNCSGNATSGDMFMNYMDYTDDACMNIFTQDQKTRMIASINNNRSGLLTSNGCSNADYGCTDQTAYNYSSVAIFNDGSCCYNAGCTDITAINYDPSVCYDDGSCQPPILGCTNPSAINFDPNANTTVAFGGALIAIGVLSFSVVSNPITASVCFVICVTFGEMLSFPFSNTFALTFANDQNRGKYMGLYTMTFSFAHVIAPIGWFKFADHYGYNMTWIFGAGLCVLASFFIYLYTLRAPKVV